MLDQGGGLNKLEREVGYPKGDAQQVCVRAALLDEELKDDVAVARRTRTTMAEEALPGELGEATAEVGIGCQVGTEALDAVAEVAAILQAERVCPR